MRFLASAMLDVWPIKASENASGRELDRQQAKLPCDDGRGGEGADVGRQTRGDVECEALPPEPRGLVEVVELCVLDRTDVHLADVNGDLLEEVVLAHVKLYVKSPGDLGPVDGTLEPVKEILLPLWRRVAHYPRRLAAADGGITS
eukprot:764153-Hanusia_phi.AAC.9